MKTFSCGLGFSFLIFGSAFADEPQFSVAERGFNHRVWERTESRSDRQIVTGRYTELETGMHYVGEDGQWREAEAVIEITPTGAAALKGRHKVYFLSNLNAPGAVDLVMPNQKRLTSHILGLSYFDSATGKSVLIAELKDSVGVLNPPNEVIYPNAFTDLKADVRYTYTKAGFEQDVIFREQFASPAEYGLNPQTTRLQLLTEFADPPVPRIETLAQGERRNDLIIDFGAMAMGLGKAFLIGDAQPQRQIAVAKTWGKLAGRDFLIEEIDYPNVKTQLETLPLPAHALRKPGINGVRHLVSNERRLPERAANKTDRVPIRIAKLNPSKPGFVLDYSVMSSATNFTFKGDTTYYVSGLVNLSSNTVIEGGAVVKFTNFNAHVARSISITGTIDCRTGPYRPAVFTSKDDNTVGETISGSTGTPSGYYGDGLVIYTSGNALHDLRLAYLERGVSGVPIIGDLNLAHLQFVFCKRPVFFSPFTCGLGGCDNKLTLDNALIYSCDTAFFGEHGTWRGQHVTVHDCNTLTYDSGNNATIVLTNSLLVAVTNAGNMPSTLVSTAEYSSDAGIFQTVGAGSHYLADGSTNRNGGVAGISADLAFALHRLTTFPPLVLTNNFTNSVTLCPQAHRNFDKPDRGYHYPPLDFVFTGLKVTNSTLTIVDGTAVGLYGNYGLTLETAATVVSVGSPVNLNRIVRYNTVQEQATTNWSGNAGTMVKVNSGTAQARFIQTEWSVLGGSETHFYDGAGISSSFVQCQFSSGIFSIEPGSTALTNSLWRRVYVNLRDEENDHEWNLYNNLFYGGTLYFKALANDPVLRAYDNLFDQTTITRGGGSEYFTHDYNGYVTNQSRLGNPYGSHDKILTNNPVYLSGPLGRHYYPTNDGMLSLLINAGSRSATAAGLAHYTTLTNQVQEGTASTNTVDIGFHYAPVRGISEIPKSSFTLTSSTNFLDKDHDPLALTLATDGLLDTFWATLLGIPPCSNSVSGWLRIDVGSSKLITQFAYAVNPVSFSQLGAVWHYEIYVTDSATIGTNAPVAKGNWGWSTNAEIKVVRFPATSGQYVFFNCVKGANAVSKVNFFKANELWIYESAASGPQYIPTDFDNDMTDDYLSDWGPPVSITRPARVDVPNSAGNTQGGDCCNGGSGCDTSGAPRRESADVTGAVAGVSYTFDAIIEAKVEQRNSGFDMVSMVTQDFCREPGGLDQNQEERKFFFAEGNNCALGCADMLVLTVTNTFAVRATRPLLLEFNPVDPIWHQGAYATNKSVILKGALQADLP